MTRRVLASLAAIAFLFVACGAPAASPLTDPKEILVQTVLSLKNVKTIETTGTVTGSISLGERGSLPLDGTTFSAAADVAGEKARFNLDAPSFLGTKVEAIVVDRVAYLRMLGGLAMFFPGGSGDKFTKTDLGAAVPQASASTSPNIQAAIDELRAAIDKLPSPPTKQADERCGDTDCYHVTISLTSEQLESLGGSAPAGVEGSVALDVWSRKNDLRPAKLTIAVDGGTQGQATTTLEFRYDAAVTIEPPPPDQVAPG
jgi:hypothetical protein